MESRLTAVSPRSTRHAVFQGALALFIGVAPWIATAHFPETIGQSTYFLASVASIAAMIAVTSPIASIASITIAFASVAYLVLPPVGSFYVASVADRVRLTIVWAMCAAGAAVLAKLREQQRHLLQREDELKLSERRSRALLEEASDAILVLDAKARVQLANRLAREMLRREFGELEGAAGASLFIAADGELPTEWSNIAENDAPLRSECRMRRGDGSLLTAELSARALPDRTIQVIIRDVTERRLADNVVRAERDLLDGIMETSPAGILAIDLKSERVIFANQRVIDAMGMTRSELYSVPLNGRPWQTTDLSGRPLSSEEMPANVVARTGKPVMGMRLRFVMPNGVELLTSLNAALLKDESGKPHIIVETLEDITEQVATQQALHESELRMRVIAEAFPGVIFQFRLNGDGEMRFTYLSDGIRELIGIAPSEGTGTFGNLWQYVLEEYHEGLQHSIQDTALSTQPWSQDFRIRDTAGRVKWVRGTSYPSASTETGDRFWNGVLLDVTQLKEMEQHLLQAQKMEGIGRLAGGIAHDFNNILTAIRGNVDLLLEELPHGDERAAEVGEIRDAADRASTLTRQLLAFSRKQMMQPRDLDLNVLVRDVEKMLRRVIGEDIALLTVPGDSLGLIRADPGQLEQSLVNLAINARDAMPDGGLLTIDTRNTRLDAIQAAAAGVAPGDYVTLVVRDTGHGMSSEVRAHIFEPFFTTKPPGKGTGLGLSMVYGIVQQSAGAIVVESEQGRGATFRLFFPRVVARERTSPTFVTAIQSAQTKGRTDTLLLVEDDAAVRQLTRRLLERNGYTVRTAHDAYQALKMVEHDLHEIDLVVSDVIMPGMGGRDLMTELRRRRPDLRVLFISGYLDIDSGRLGLDRRTRLLLKPFTQDALLSTVHQMLEEAPRLEVDAPSASSAQR